MVLITILGNEFEFAGASLSFSGRESTTSKMEFTLVDSATSFTPSSFFHMSLIAVVFFHWIQHCIVVY